MVTGPQSKLTLLTHTKRAPGHKGLDSYHRQEKYFLVRVSVRSTDYDRTLMSAEANLAGLYPPSGQQIFKENLPWQPIPVHTVPQSEERLLSFPLGDCPRYKQLMNETEHTEEFINVTNTYQDIIELVRNKTGLNKTNVESVWSVYDTLFCESRHNMTAPDWVTADVMEKLRVLKDFSFQPPYASCQIFELYRDNGSVSVSMFYRNDSAVEPYPLQLPGCSLDCPLDEFVRITKLSISEDRDKECQVYSKGKDKEVIISLAVSGSLLFILIVVLLGVICLRKEPISRQGYQHVVSQDVLDKS
ncbi:hypothetical protein FQN60_006630 [Etheostoma spectabile]|uniref:Lysosomal acid phosphatase n=1 Tax=Etheostoma spectabile TaxID=54343 RepID=A0A5J5CCT8_9PERO|nr:hypothetical protein FQN60_006630 [Etheostoma spectabile]